MEKLPCSIFNDVLGPVMRGPSSSHVAGAARIASMIRQSLDAPVKKRLLILMSMVRWRHRTRDTERIWDCQRAFEYGAGCAGCRTV